MRKAASRPGSIATPEPNKSHLALNHARGKAAGQQGQVVHGGFGAGRQRRLDYGDNSSLCRARHKPGSSPWSPMRQGDRWATRPHVLAPERHPQPDPLVRRAPQSWENAKWTSVRLPRRDATLPTRPLCGRARSGIELGRAAKRRRHMSSVPEAPGAVAGLTAAPHRI